MKKETPKQSRSKSSKKQTNEQVVAQEIDEAITLTDELTAKDKAEAIAELSEVKDSMADLNNRPEIEEIVENAKNPLQHRDEDLMLENKEYYQKYR